MRQSAVFFLAAIFFCGFLSGGRAQAEITPRESAAIREYMALVNSAKTFGDLVESLKADLTTHDFAVLKEISAKYGAKPAPRLISEGNGKFTVKVESFETPFEIVSLSKEKFIVNRRPVDLSEAATFEAKLELIYKALPQVPPENGSHALWHLLLPEARAFLFLPAGYAAYVAIAGTVAAGGVGAYVGNEALCREMGEALDDCSTQVGTLEGWTAKYDTLAQDLFGIDKDGKKKRKNVASAEDKKVDLTNDTEEATNLKMWVKYREQKKKGGCPGFPVNSSLDSEVSKVIKDSKRITEQTTSRAARCQKGLWSNFQRTYHMQTSSVHSLLVECSKTIKQIATDMCLPASMKVIENQKRQDAEDDSPRPILRGTTDSTTGQH